MCIRISEFHSKCLYCSSSVELTLLTHVFFSFCLVFIISYWAIETRWNQKLESIDSSIVHICLNIVIVIAMLNAVATSWWKQLL